MLVLKMTIALAAIALLTKLAVAQQTSTTPSKADKTCSPESLVGRYRIVSGEKEGAKEPDERIKGYQSRSQGTVSWSPTRKRRRFTPRRTSSTRPPILVTSR